LYNEVYELWKKEKEKDEELQRLPKDFYGKITAYLKKLKVESRMLDKKTVKAQLLDIELSNFKIIVKELFILRYKKIREKAFSLEPVSRDILSEEEKKIYDSTLPLAESYLAFSKDILRGHLSVVNKEINQQICVLRFVQEIPALVGADMKTYGPFMPEDVATLPTENARIFLKQGLAVKVNTS
jgi:DNA replication initiation complex subunit (GINS family)